VRGRGGVLAAESLGGGQADESDRLRVAGAGLTGQAEGLLVVVDGLLGADQAELDGPQQGEDAGFCPAVDDFPSQRQRRLGGAERLRMPAGVPVHRGKAVERLGFGVPVAEFPLQCHGAGEMGVSLFELPEVMLHAARLSRT
jgi:hypothetical protein